MDSGDLDVDLGVLAVVASMLLCCVLYRVRMRQCEALLQEMARVLAEVRRTAAALQSRRAIVKAATLTAQKTLAEYDLLLSMLQRMQEGDGLRRDLPVLRHQIEMETMRAQVSMVQGCLLSMSEDVLSALPSGEDERLQVDVMTSLNKQRKSYVHMSEELLTILDKRSSEYIKLFPEEGDLSEKCWRS